METENLPAWQLRVMDEKAQLDVKISALDSFLEKGIPDDFRASEWQRMCGQLAMMRGYSQILGERIANFE